MKFGIASNTFHKYNEKKRPIVRKTIETIVFSLIGLLVIGLIYQFITSEMDKSKYKIKGKLVSLGSYRLMTNTAGTGKYSVVLESDMGTPIQQWNNLKEQLSKNYRVFSYERAGYGWSDTSGDSASIEKAVSDLKKALSKSGMSSPYVLVGHGYGGLIMTEFAKKYPNEVMGVVLIDSLTEDNIKSKDFQTDLKHQLSKYKTYQYLSYIGGIRLGYQLSLLKDDESYLAGLTDEEKGLFRSQRVVSKYFSTYYDELKVLQDYDGDLQQKDSLKDKLVEILTPAHKYGDDAKDAAYIEEQKTLTEMSAKAEQNVVERTGSYIQIDRPDSVMNAVDKIVKKVNKL